MSTRLSKHDRRRLNTALDELLGAMRYGNNRQDGAVGWASSALASVLGRSEELDQLHASNEVHCLSARLCLKSPPVAP